MPTDSIVIRKYHPDDFDELVAMWHDTNQASYPYLATEQAHTLIDATGFFRNHILTTNSVWVAESNSRLVGLIALNGALISQLSIARKAQRMGIGTQLLQIAFEVSPSRLHLFTFQKNTQGQSFYEKHGFIPVAYGISPEPECEPDVEYQWIPYP